MSNVRKLNVDMEAVLEAMGTGSPLASYLDLEKGEIVEVPGEEWELEIKEDARELMDQIDAHPERYLEMPRIEARQEYRWMERFAESIDEEDIREKLEIALQGKGAFGRFRDVVSRYGDIADRWYAHRKEAALKEALDWFWSHEIEPVYELKPLPPEKASPPKAAPKVHLDHVLVLGAPEGKTEVMDGRVVREIHARTETEARGLFKTLARDVCEYRGVTWRKSLIEGASAFELAGIRVRLDGTRVEVQIEVPREVLRAFEGPTA